jgi:hypothetical protein
MTAASHTDERLTSARLAPTARITYLLARADLRGRMGVFCRQRRSDDSSAITAVVSAWRGGVLRHAAPVVTSPIRRLVRQPCTPDLSPERDARERPASADARLIRRAVRRM